MADCALKCEYEIRCIAFDIIQKIQTSTGNIKCTLYAKDPKDEYVGNGKEDDLDQYHCYAKEEFWTIHKFRLFEGEKGRCRNLNG